MDKKEKSLKILRKVLMILPFIVSIIGAILLFVFPYLGTKINLLICLIIFVLSFIVLGLFILCKKKQSKIIFIIAILFSLIITSAVTYADYIYFRLHSEIGRMTTNEEYVYSYIYVLKGSNIASSKDLTNKSIGLQSSSSTTCYQTIIDGLDKENIQCYTTSSYSNFVNAAGDLLNGTVQAIAVDEQGLSMINEVYPEFNTKATQIAEFKQKVDTSSSSTSVNMAKEPFTILINGVDTRTGDLNTGSNADVIMLATFNPQTMKLSMISIPRDSYVNVPCRGGYDKITHSGSGGITCTIEALEQTFDITINYYVKVNFKAVVNLVDAIGGIDVNVPITFCEQDSNDVPDTICLNEGYQHLDGEQALALSRHRKTLPNGDIGRGVNQQIVIEGMIDKLASGQIITSLDSLLSVLGDNVQTNMTQKDMYNLFSLLTNLGSQSTFSNTSALSISSSTIAGQDAMIYTDWAGTNIYYYIPYKESLEAVTTEINRIIGTEDYPLPTSDFTFDANKPYDQYELETSNGIEASYGTPSYDVSKSTSSSSSSSTSSSSQGSTSNSSSSSSSSSNSNSTIQIEVPSITLPSSSSSSSQDTSDASSSTEENTSTETTAPTTSSTTESSSESTSTSE